MKKYKSYLLLVMVAFVFGTQTMQAQSSYYIITGKVLQEGTGQPLQAASVVAQQTTIGTATDAEGRFRLALPNGGYDVSVSFTGYQVMERRVNNTDAGQEILFELSPKEKELTAVSVVASGELKNGWEKYGSFFLDEFIGKTENSRQCRILNTQDLKFYFSRKRNRLKVMADVPLEVQNEALGYTIKYTLDSFVHEYASGVSLFTGYPVFEEMKTDSTNIKAQWKLRRELAYEGSILHFMRALYSRSLDDEGFDVQVMTKAGNRDTALRAKDPYALLGYHKNDSLNTVSIQPQSPDIAVIYTIEKPAIAYIKGNPGQPKDIQFSVIGFLSKDPVTIEQNGFYYEQSDIILRNYWTWEKIADMLPYDYIDTSAEATD